MNKQERKRKEKRYLDRRADKLKQEGTNLAINILQVLPCYILAHQGYGNVRIERFIKELYRLTDKIKKDERVLKTIINELEYDKGIRFDIATGEVDNLWRIDEHDNRTRIRKPKEVRK